MLVNCDRNGGLRHSIFPRPFTHNIIVVVRSFCIGKVLWGSSRNLQLNEIKEKDMETCSSDVYVSKQRFPISDAAAVWRLKGNGIGVHVLLYTSPDWTRGWIIPERSNRSEWVYVTHRGSQNSTGRGEETGKLQDNRVVRISQRSRPTAFPNPLTGWKEAPAQD